MSRQHLLHDLPLKSDSSMQPLVLIIDDEEDILDLLSYNFSRAGFRVAAFEEASPALDFLGANRPEAILCDWMMPEMTGIEVCRKVKSDFELADIPFIMVTCRSEKSAIREARAEGVTDFIIKPVRINELVDQVKTLVAEQAA